MRAANVTDLHPTDLRSGLAWFRHWMMECALPFWRDHGHEGPGGGACEALSLSGVSAGLPFKRTRVQARQLYVFSQAALLGWADGERLARETYGFMKRAERPDGGWVRRLSPDGAQVLDRAVDLYDQAFVLFALAWFARAGGGAEPLMRARRTLGWLRAHMASPPGGFVNAVPPQPGPRQQNPHMHLLEAALALHETAAEGAYAELAHELVALFRARLFDGGTGVLGELFGPDWTVLPDAAVEPGHHFEWVWLLDAYQQRFGVSMDAELGGLYRFAAGWGVAPGTGLVRDAVSRSGATVRGSARLWPQTEALRAHAVTTRRGGDAELALRTTLGNLRTRYLSGCPSGSWIDQLDERGQPVSTSVPTSSFYHLMTAYAELQRLARD